MSKNFRKYRIYSMDKYASRVIKEFIRIIEFHAMIFIKYQIITELFCMSDDNNIKAKTE